MRTARTTGLASVLGWWALSPMALLAASVPNFPPNPEGERLYLSHEFLLTLFPVAAAACGLLVAGIVHKFARKAGH